MKLKQFIKDKQDLIRREKEYILNKGQFKQKDKDKQDLDEEQMLTLNIMCKTKELKNRYIEEYSNEIYIQDGIWEMQEDLLQEGVGQDITDKDIEKLITEENWIELHKKLNKLFLDWIPYEHINVFVERLLRKEITCADLIEKHKDQLGACFLGLVREN